MDEIWKDIPGYEGLYQVSNLGRVKSIEHVVIRDKVGKINVPKKILKPGINSTGYYLVVLCNNGKRQTIKVHRVVAECFIPNPKNKLEVNHIDGNKLNNNITNLEWCTSSENSKHAWDIGLVKNMERPWLIEANKKRSCMVKRYSIHGSYIDSFSSISEASRKVGISVGCIIKVCNGKFKHAGGFIFKKA